VKIEPGDFVVADDDCAIVEARLIATEVDVQREFSAGLSLANALATFGHV
jgi:regulator of RNase E activity RraA